MFKAIETVFTPQQIEPHGAHFIPDHSGLMWFTIYSNVLIVIAYALIPTVAVFIVRKRKDLVFNWVFLLIGLFISLCGVTHFMHIVVYWYPYYMLQAVIGIVTAIASLSAFFALLYAVPKIVKLTSPKQMEEISQRLNEEVQVFSTFEEELNHKNLSVSQSNKEVEEKIEELQRLNVLMQGREEKIRELENELRTLNK